MFDLNILQDYMTSSENSNLQAISDSDYVVLNDGTFVNNDSERLCK
jgi:hypothetical protein